MTLGLRIFKVKSVSRPRVIANILTFYMPTCLHVSVSVILRKMLLNAVDGLSSDNYAVVWRLMYSTYVNRSSYFFLAYIRLTEQTDLVVESVNYVNNKFSFDKKIRFISFFLCKWHFSIFISLWIIEFSIFFFCHLDHPIFSWFIEGLSDLNNLINIYNRQILK